ncbi:MAG: PRC-barrel domain-containing protein [Stellaceae bacterium]
MRRLAPLRRLGAAVILVVAVAMPAAAAPAPKKQEHAMPAKPHLTAKRQADGILGKRVYGAHGADMGLVTDVLVNRKGKPIAVVIDFGGFLGVGTRKIAISWHLLHFRPGDTKRPVTVNLGKAQLRAAPAYEPGKPAQILNTTAPAKPPPAPSKSPARPPPGPKTTSPTPSQPQPAPQSVHGGK